jgi:hypothetical protein
MQRRRDYHESQVHAAVTPDALLAATFDRFRVSARGPAAREMAGVLVDHATAIHGLTLAPGRAERGLAGLKAARGDRAVLLAAFSWYRAEVAGMRRAYGDDPEFRKMLDASIRDVAVYLNSQASGLENLLAG